MEEVQFVKLNNTYGKIVTTDISVYRDLYKRFSIPVKDYWFMPAFKSGRWDGKIHFVTVDGKFYNGLLPKILKYFEGSEEYTVNLDPEYNKDFPDSDAFKRDFIEYTNKTMTNVIPYAYQLRGAMKAIYHKRAICEHATGSGKSYTIALAINYLNYKFPEKKILVLVPNLDLIEQLTESFAAFGLNKDLIGKYSGKQKDIDKQIIVSTWQSAYKDIDFCRMFHVLIADEAHGLQSDEIRSVAEKAIFADYRIGFTGTLPEDPANKFLVEGVMGPVVDQILYDELRTYKTVSEINIKVIKLNYPMEKHPWMEHMDYDLEKKFIELEPFRNEVIVTLASGMYKKKLNTLILVKKITHGERLVESLKKLNLEVDFICGEVDVEQRNIARKEFEQAEGKIIVATTGVFSTGISINRLHCVIFAAAGKSKIQTLQSVGRGLRLHPTKEALTLYDIAENLNISKKHVFQRLKYYEANKFNVTVKEINVNAKTFQSPQKTDHSDVAGQEDNSPPGHGD